MLKKSMRSMRFLGIFNYFVFFLFVFCFIFIVMFIYCSISIEPSRNLATVLWNLPKRNTKKLNFATCWYLTYLTLDIRRLTWILTLTLTLTLTLASYGDQLSSWALKRSSFNVVAFKLTRLLRLTRQSLGKFQKDRLLKFLVYCA